MTLEAATYDQTVRRCIRVIVWCELEKMRLRAMLAVLTIEEAVARVMDPAAVQDLEELRQAIKDEIQAVQEMEDSARRLLYQLRRDHGELNTARQTAPEYGAEKHYHVGTGEVQ